MSEEEIKKILENHEQRITKLENLFKSEPKITKKISLKEFILSKNPKDDLQKTLVIGYYLEKYENIPSFNISDLDTSFRTAKERVPKNLNDMVNKNIGKGFMMEAKEKRDNKKTFVLTSTGERFVENDLKKR